MRRLPEAVKRRIVEHLACYRTPADVVDLVAEEFDITLSARHVRAYDPTSFQFAGSDRWTVYHRTVRRRCVEQLGEIAIAHKAYRMRQLQQIFDAATDRGNYREALKALEQAAKEMGGWYLR